MFLRQIPIYLNLVHLFIWMATYTGLLFEEGQIEA